VSNVALWVVVVFETILLLLLLRVLGGLRQQGAFRALTWKELRVGEQGPPLEATSLDGKTVTLEDSRGYFRILAFIAPGCTACNSTIKVLDEYNQAESNLTIVVVGSNDLNQNREYAEKHNVLIPILTPNPGFGPEQYHVQGFPSVFILDENRVIRAKGIVNERSHLQSLLQEASAPVSLHL
jgi:methylamine dehydrogenase accessory protein MauD